MEWFEAPRVADVFLSMFTNPLMAIILREDGTSLSNRSLASLFRDSN